jgi:HEAT repeat protein
MELVLQASSPDPDQRFEAVGELARSYSGTEVDDVLVAAVADQDLDVAATALAGLAERGHPRARTLILTSLQSNDPTRRARALRAAGVVDIGPHLEDAWRALEERTWVQRMAGAAALAMARATDALPAIRRLAERAGAVRQPAAEAHLRGSAALLGDQESAQLFLDRLAGRRDAARMASAAFLERRGRVEDLAALIGRDALRSALATGMSQHEARRASARRRRARGGYPKLIECLLRRLDVMI